MNHAPHLQSRRKKRGNSWEHTIETECEFLRELKHSAVVRCPDAMRVVGKGTSGNLEAIHVRTSAPDFFGTLWGGRSVAFDAKRCGAARFPLPAVGKGWWHQIESLSETTAYGGIGFLYVLNDSDTSITTRRYVLPVVDGRIAGHDVNKDRSIPFSQLDDYKVHPSETWWHWVASHLNQWTWQETP